ncbi:MAG: phosphoribosylanthranilate isomerase [Gammaproteobacteria bacterium]|jgi:phosphoribosylanthranilate isomerase
MRTRVKICGITRVEDASAAAQLGADAIGLVFYAKSPRAVSIAQAQAVVRALPPFVTIVGLFVDAAPEEIREVLAAVPLDLLQFHGKEAAQACRGYGRPYLKVVHMAGDTDVVDLARPYDDAAGILVDTYVQGVPGGTGRSFDWSRLPAALTCPLILAGGLTPDNVAAAVAQVRPWAVDVSGGVEAAPGIKDAAKIAAFIRGVDSVEID